MNPECVDKPCEEIAGSASETDPASGSAVSQECASGKAASACGDSEAAGACDSATGEAASSGDEISGELVYSALKAVLGK